MSLHPHSLAPIPEATARVARMALPRGNLYLKMHDALGALFADNDFAPLFPHGANRRKRPGGWRW